jgi:Ser/Thr protein kinase RdoA (MazF antagonist)
VRATVLFTHANGRLPKSVDDSRRYGEAVAQMHNAMEDFASNAERLRIDLRHLLDQPLDLILRWVAARPADSDYLKGLADRLRDEVDRRRADLSTGFGHGDAWGGNAHATDHAVTFFDFDCCCEGWRSDELAIFIYGQALAERPDAPAHCAAYFAGYRAQRVILPADFDAIPLFVLLRQIWHLGLHMRWLARRRLF